jgi:hypothetical protein
MGKRALQPHMEERWNKCLELQRAHCQGATTIVSPVWKGSRLYNVEFRELTLHEVDMMMGCLAEMRGHEGTWRTS